MSQKKGIAGKKVRKKTPKAVVVLAVLAILLFVSGGALAYSYGQELKLIEQMRSVVEVDTFYPGLSVGGVSLAGMTYEQAEALVMGADAERLASYTASIRVEGREWSEHIPSSSNAREALDDAYQYAREGELDVRFAAVNELAEHPRDFPIEYASDAAGLTALVDSIALELDIPPVDAAVENFDFESKTFNISEDSQGRALDKDALIQQIAYAVDNGLYPIQVSGTLMEIQPQITKEQLSGRNKLLASFATKTTSDAKRNNNIKLCSDAFNGTILLPGEVFSLNEKTGRRSTDKGYQDAGAIKNGKLIPEPGGGVCQVSTTLFNAVVRAGMQIVERNNHSYPISYIEIGQDAMIDYPNYDFKFTNNSDGPVYLVAHFADQKITIELYGEPVLEDGERIELRSETTATIEPGPTEYIPDPTLLIGQEEDERSARTGYRVTTYIQRWVGESMVSEEELFKSSYTPYSRTVRVGTMEYYVPPATDIPILGDTNGESDQLGG